MIENLIEKLIASNEALSAKLDAKLCQCSPEPATTPEVVPKNAKAQVEKPKPQPTVTKEELQDTAIRVAKANKLSQARDIMQKDFGIVALQFCEPDKIEDLNKALLKLL